MDDDRPDIHVLFDLPPVHIRAPAREVARLPGQIIGRRFRRLVVLDLLFVDHAAVQTDEPDGECRRLVIGCDDHVAFHGDGVTLDEASVFLLPSPERIRGFLLRIDHRQVDLFPGHRSPQLDRLVDPVNERHCVLGRQIDCLDLAVLPDVRRPVVPAGEIVSGSFRDLDPAQVDILSVLHGLCRDDGLLVAALLRILLLVIQCHCMRILR